MAINSATIEWDWVKILISIAVSMLGSMTTIQILKYRSIYIRQFTNNNNTNNNGGIRLTRLQKARSRWISLLFLFAASITFGCVAVWSMHFVGMLALSLYDNSHTIVEMNYEPGFTVLSCIFSILAAFISFLFSSNSFHIIHPKLIIFDFHYMHVNIDRLYKHLISYTVGGLFGALAIVAMHYVGMAAVKGNFIIEWNYGIIIGSTVIAFTADTVGMIILFELERFWIHDFRLVVLSTGILTSAVCTMHYIGMLAADYQLMAIYTNTGYYLSHSTILAIILIFALLSCSVSLGLIFYQFSRRLEVNLTSQSIEISALKNELNSKLYELSLIQSIRPVFRLDALKLAIILNTGYNNTNNIAENKHFKHVSIMKSKNSIVNNTADEYYNNINNNRDSMTLSPKHANMNPSKNNNGDLPNNNILGATLSAYTSNPNLLLSNNSDNNNNNSIPGMLQLDNNNNNSTIITIEPYSIGGNGGDNNSIQSPLSLSAQAQQKQRQHHQQQQHQQQPYRKPTLLENKYIPIIPKELYKHNSNTITNSNNSNNPIDNNISLITTATIDDIDFKDILSHNVCIEIFRDALYSNYSIENIEFYLEVNRYKLLFESQYNSYKPDRINTIRVYIATSIINDFIRVGSRYQVNISNSQRSYILSKLIPELSIGECSYELFDNSQNEIYNLMYNDLFPRFIKTKQYLICKFILNQ